MKQSFEGWVSAKITAQDYGVDEIADCVPNHRVRAIGDGSRET
jgi:hypothetical protein